VIAGLKLGVGTPESAAALRKIHDQWEAKNTPARIERRRAGSKYWYRKRRLAAEK
jgi:hypothetical protein